MKLTKTTWIRAARWIGMSLLGLACAWVACAQTISTTTVQGTVYLANGAPGSGTLLLSWPAFTTASGDAVAAGRTSATIGTDGFVSVNLVPNLGSSPAGLFYTAVYNMSDGSTSTEYWVVPAAAQATIAQVRAQVMPAAQAVQAVTKTYVDQAIQTASTALSPSGGTLYSPLYLSGDPTQALQAADKHYVDSSFALALPLSGGALTGPLTLAADPISALQPATKQYADTKLPLAGGTLTGPLNGTSATFGTSVTGKQVGARYQADQFTGADASVKINSCISAAIAAGGGICDATNLGGTQTMSQQINVGSSNPANVSTTLLMPAQGIWTWNLTGGASCGMMLYDGSSVIGSGVGGGGDSRMLLEAGGAANMDAILCTDPANSIYVRVEGFGVQNNGGTMANGVLHVYSLFDSSSFKYIMANNSTGDVVHIDAACCGSSFDHIVAGSSADSGVTGGTVLTIKSGRDLVISNSTFNNPKIGSYNVLLPDTGTIESVTFKNVYMEKAGTSDSATPMVYVGSGNNNVVFENGFASAADCTTNPCSQSVFENHTISGFAVRHFGASSYMNAAVNDVAYGQTWGVSGTQISGYQSGYAGAPYAQNTVSSQSSVLSKTSSTVQKIAGAITFTPTAIGWYRVISGTGNRSSGTMYIDSAYDNQATHASVDYSVGAYGIATSIAVRNAQSYGSGVIDQIEASSDGAAHMYLDIHVRTATTPGPISIIFESPSTPSSVLVASPVVGAVPGTAGISLVNQLSNYASYPYMASGPLWASSFVMTCANNTPCGMSTDASGNLLFKPTYNHIILQAPAVHTIQLLNSAGIGLVLNADGSVTVPAIKDTGVTSASLCTDSSGTLTACAKGLKTLSSGTVTVSNAAACTPSATCVYKLTNCGPGASTAIGTLSIGTVTAGTSFVINSLTATNTVASGDVSQVCWKIN